MKNSTPGWSGSAAGGRLTHASAVPPGTGSSVSNRSPGPGLGIRVLVLVEEVLRLGLRSVLGLDHVHGRLLGARAGTVDADVLGDLVLLRVLTEALVGSNEPARARIGAAV